MNSSGANVHADRAEHVEACHVIDNENGSPNILCGASLGAPSTLSVIQIHPIQASVYPATIDGQNTCPPQLKNPESSPLSNDVISTRKGRSVEGDEKSGSFTVNDSKMDAAPIEGTGAVEETSPMSSARGGVSVAKKGVYRRSSNPRKKSDDPSLSIFRVEEYLPHGNGSPSKLFNTRTSFRA